MITFGVGWFLSVAFLLLLVAITQRITNKEISNAVQSFLVVVWIMIGVVAILW